MNIKIVPEREYDFGQIVRLLDIFIIGPILVLIAVKGKIHPQLKILLILLAVATIIYNSAYYVKYQKVISGAQEGV